MFAVIIAFNSGLVPYGKIVLKINVLRGACLAGSVDRAREP